MQNAHILCIESSGINCSVALTENGKIIAEKSENTGQFSHAEKLHVFIEDVLQNTKMTVNDLQAVAVSSGPGSYTGLRIGVSAAKGLCFALQIPLIAIPTLQTLAVQVEAKCIIPMLDARRMEVFSAVFDENHHEIEKTKAQVINNDSFSFLALAGKNYVHWRWGKQVCQNMQSSECRFC